MGVLAGGGPGPAVVAGKAADSLLVKMAGHTAKPFMPPPGEADLTPQELALVKLWIDQGAKGATVARGRPAVALGPLPPRVQPVRALAVAPDKSLVAVGRGGVVQIHDAKSGELRRTLDPRFAGVEALAFAPDGRRHAAAGFRRVVV